MKHKLPKNLPFEEVKTAFRRGKINRTQFNALARRRLKDAEELLQRAMDDHEKLRSRAVKEDPFYFYEPNNGDLSQEGRKLLEELLHPDDIPVSLPGQLDVHKCSAGIIGASGGNQSGKSVCGAIEAFIKATGELPLSLRGVYPESKLPKTWPQAIRVISVSDKQLENTVIPTYKKWCPRRYLLNGSWSDSFNSKYRRLTLYERGREKSYIEFATSRQDVDTFQGPPLTKVIYDEEPPYRIYQENLFRFVTSDAIDILFCWTPTKGLTWLKDLFSSSEDEDGNRIERFMLCSATNKTANLTVLKRLCREAVRTDGYEALKMRLLGEFVSLSGLIYGRLFSRKAHVIPPFEINKRDYIVYRGLDPHTAKPSVCVEMAVDREGVGYVCGAFAEAVDTSVFKKIMAERAKARNYRLGWTRCDVSANSTNHALGDRNIYKELRRGKYAVPALKMSRKYTGSIGDGVDVIKQKLRPNDNTGKPMLYFFDTKEVMPVISSMENLERHRGNNEDKTGEVDKIAEGRYDYHAALRYIHQSSAPFIPHDLGSGVQEYEPVNLRVNY